VPKKFNPVTYIYDVWS